jgi:rare lipoprotein A
MVRRLALTGGLTVMLVSMPAEGDVWPRQQGQVGWAPWYGAYHHGRQTASGERFSMHALTAAHRSLPFGTEVLVTNLDTDQQVQVTINDRGPFVDQQRRVIDLSRAAAARLGMLQQGVGRVRVDIVEDPGPWWDRPAPPIASATLVRPLRPMEGKSAPSASRQVPAEQKAAERAATHPAGEGVTWQRMPRQAKPVAASSVSWTDCPTAATRCLAGD